MTIKLLQTADDLLAVGGGALPSTLTIGSDKRIGITPRDAAGNTVAAYLPLDEVSPLTNKGQVFFKELITGHYAISTNKKTFNPSIKFGTDCMAQTLGFTMLPASSAIHSATKFTVDVILKFSSVAAGTVYILNSYITVNGYRRWALGRTADKLFFSSTNAAGVAVTCTTASFLTTTDVFRVRITYDGSFNDGSCLCTISAAVDGNALTDYSPANKNQCNKIPAFALPNGVGVGFGGYFIDHATSGAYATAADSNYINEAVFYDGLLLSPTATPSTTALTPFATPDVVQMVFNPGSTGVFDLSSFTVSDTAQCSATNGGDGWNFNLDNGATWYGLTQLQALPDVTAANLTVYAKPISSTGLVDYKLAWFQITATPATVQFPADKGYIKQNTVVDIPIHMKSCIDGETGETGLTPTIKISKAGGVFNTITPALIENGLGWYTATLVVADTDTLGNFILVATDPLCDPFSATYEVVQKLLSDLQDVSKLDIAKAMKDQDVSLTVAIAGSIEKDLLDADVADVTLGDSDDNKLVIAKAIRTYDASAIPPVADSIQSDLTIDIPTAILVDPAHQVDGEAISTNLNAPVGSIPTNPLLDNSALLPATVIAAKSDVTGLNDLSKLDVAKALKDQNVSTTPMVVGSIEKDLLDADVSAVTLDDSTVNKNIIAKSLKSQDVSSTPAIVGSVENDLLTTPPVGTVLLADSDANKLIVATALKDQDVSGIPTEAGSVLDEIEQNLHIYEVEDASS